MSTLRRLNLGCGKSPKPGYINIDSRELSGVDVVRDLLRGLPYDDSSIDEIFSENTLEHIPQTEVIWMMNEMWRVLRPGARMRHHVPMAGTVNFYKDPTHLSHWVPDTLTYFTKDSYHNKYYEGLIKPWLRISCEPISETVMDFILEKP